VSQKRDETARGIWTLATRFIASLRARHPQMVSRLRFLRGIHLGIFGGITGVILIYLIGWTLAEDSTSKTKRALSDAYKPGIAELIYAQAMAESLTAAEGPAGGPVQTRVLALAEALNERENFSPDLASYEIEAIQLAADNACLEHRILGVGIANILGSAQPDPSCPDIAKETDLEKVETERLAAEQQYQGILSQIAQARASAQFDGDPRAETTAARMTKQATIAAFKGGRLQLTAALIFADRGELVKALEMTRGYAVSSQSDLKGLEQLVSQLEYLVPHSQNWHERHHEEIAQDGAWTDLKVSAGDVTRDLAFATDLTGKEYRNLGGVEGSVRLYLEEQRQGKGQALGQAQQFVLAKEQHLASASATAKQLRELLLSASTLTSARIDAQENSLRALLFSVQLWHLTWGLLAGLAGGLLGEGIGRIQRLISGVKIPWHRTSRPHAVLSNRSTATFQLVGLLVGTLVSIRVGDRLDELTSFIVNAATQRWYAYFGFIVILGATASLIGSAAGNVLISEPAGRHIVRKDGYVTGAGGVLFGITTALLLDHLLAGKNIVGQSLDSDSSVQGQLLALALVGGVFGSLIGARLLTRKRPAHALAS
jgi:hypothetical protein